MVFGKGSEVKAATGDKGVRFLLVSGRRLGEPIAWCGLIAINTQEELWIAFGEYENGTFIKSEKQSRGDVYLVKGEQLCIATSHRGKVLG